MKKKYDADKPKASSAKRKSKASAKNQKLKKSRQSSRSPNRQREEAREEARDEAQRQADNRKVIIDFLSMPDYQPLKIQRLRAAMGVPKRDMDEFSRTIRELEDRGMVVNLSRKGYALAQSADLVSGTISFHRAGSAIVTDAVTGKEVFVPAEDTGTALPGDRVMVRINRTLDRGAGKANDEGSVIRVLERNTKTIVGTLKLQRRIYYVKPMQATITHNIIVPDPAGAAEGDRVLVRLEAWDEPHISPEGEIIDVIGPADDPSLDTIAVTKSYDLPEMFPDSVIREAENLSITEADLEERLDLRKKFIFTIDPATARDFDDAISLEKTKSGWRLGVHIADVSHFVKPGSELDKEAIARGTSVYFPDKVIPMLPEQLSNGLCSLKPNVDRLAFSVFMTVDNDGDVKQVKFGDSVINSKLRLTYEQALEVLELPAGKSLPEAGVTKSTAEKLRKVHQLAQAMRAKRMRDGALSMEVPEVKFILGNDGRIQDLQPTENDISHQLIEECMLAANEAVCRELCDRGVPLLHRIHQEPDIQKLAELEENFVTLGINTGDLSNRRNMTRLMKFIEKKTEAHAWFSVILRSMKRAMYSAECVGHYGLAKTFYCHFTSPIRRYPDLVVHRQLRAVLHRDRILYNKNQLAELGTHCSDREYAATEAERELIDLKRLRFLGEQLERGEPETYDAVIMDVRNFGIFVHVDKMQAYGLVHVSHLDDDFYDFNPKAMELRGRRTGKAYRIGDRFQVIVAKVDFEKRQLDFQPLPDETATTKSESSDRKPRKTKRRRKR